MNTMEFLRRRIANVQDMQSVVSTMKTMAAVNIRQYEAAVEALCDYDRTIQLGFHILFRQRARSLASHDDSQHQGAIVIGSDQGLCGQFNDDIAQHALARMDQPAPSKPQWSVLAVGGRTSSRVEDAGQSIDRSFHVPVSVSDITRLLQELVPRIENWQTQRNITRVFVFYNVRTSAASYRPHQLQLLPISMDHLNGYRGRKWPSRSLPTYTMPWRDLFAAIIRQYLFVGLFRACAESRASENASRIASMQAAEKNIERRLIELRTQYNQGRQTAITEELLDVVTGFEALTAGKGTRG